jgi:hypothetical protein
LAEPFFAAFREAFTGAFFAAVFLAARFLATVGVSVFFAAWNAAHRFLVASTMAFLPAALSFRFGLGASGATGDDGSDSFLDSAGQHLAEFGYLCVDTKLLLFKTLDGGGDDFRCEFVGGHIRSRVFPFRPYSILYRRR